MSNGITDVLETLSNNSELLKGFGTTITAEGLSFGAKKAGEAGKIVKAGAMKFGSLVVEPAVWAISGKAPSLVEGFLWGAGAASSLAGNAIGSGAAAGTSIAKAIVDNQSNKKLQEAMRSEPDITKARYMDLCSNFRSTLYSAQTNALLIAQSGGVAWQHSNGFWVYIKDARGGLVCNYLPSNFSKLYCPYLPITPVGGGKVEIETY